MTCNFETFLLKKHLKNMMLGSLLIISSCGFDRFSDFSDNYFPIRTGSTWNYEVILKNDGHLEEFRKVIYVRELVENSNEKLAKLIDLRGREQLISINKHNEVHYHADASNKRHDKTILKKNIVIPKGVTKGMQWTNEDVTKLLRAVGPWEEPLPIVHSLKMRNIVKNESIMFKLSSGKRIECIVIESSGSTTINGGPYIGPTQIQVTKVQWFGKNVGLVKSIRTERASSKFIKEARSTEILMSYEY